MEMLYRLLLYKIPGPDHGALEPDKLELWTTINLRAPTTTVMNFMNNMIDFEAYIKVPGLSTS